MDEKREIEFLLTAEVLNLAHQIMVEKARKGTSSSMDGNIPEAVRLIKQHRQDVIKRLSAAQ